MNKTRVVIADDSALMRQAMEMTLDAQFEVAAVVEDGEAAVAAAASLSPEVILLDISMPGLNGLEAGRQIKQASPMILLIFVSGHEEKSYREAGFKAGGSGYVIKRQMMSELLPAIQDVLIGKEYGRLTA